MKTALLTCVFLLSLVSVAQEPILKLTDSIMGSYQHFSTDNFGRIYLSNEDVILQFSADCDTMFSASLKALRPTSIESSKSFRTLVFDAERQVIHFYDNTLTDIHGEIDLVNYDIQQPILACESFAGNTFWILDAGTMRLIKLNANLELVSQTENLATLFEDKQLPAQMLESNDYLYVSIPERGVAIFDVFGTFIKLFPCKPDHISVKQNYLLIRTGDKIQVVLADNVLESDYVYTVPEDVTEFAFAHDKVYLLREKGLFVGKYTQKD